MDRNEMHACPWCNPNKSSAGYRFSESQATRASTKIKDGLVFRMVDIIQCPYCGKRVKKTRWGWKQLVGRT